MGYKQPVDDNRHFRSFTDCGTTELAHQRADGARGGHIVQRMVRAQNCKITLSSNKEYREEKNIYFFYFIHTPHPDWQ